MDINPLNGGFGMNPSNSSNKPAEEKEDFLKLLVTQLRFQDPLNPMEGSDFAAQLAQFSSLEQLTNIHTKLDEGIEADLLAARSINNTMASTFIGKEVQAFDDRVMFDGTSEEKLHFYIPDYAARVSIEIRTAEGALIQRIEHTNLEAGLQSVEWNGRNMQNNLVPIGEYYYSVSATGRGNQGMAAQPLNVGIVEGVKFVDGNPVLQINSRDVDYGSVFKVSMPKTQPVESGFSLRNLFEGA